jgi:E3 SUMO-protein ligase PIAS1
MAAAASSFFSRAIRYFDEILKATPEDVEDVMVEADGEWHTSDGAYASALWKAEHPPAPPAIAPPLPPVGAVPSTSSPASSTTLAHDVAAKREKSPVAPDVEVLVLDSDDDDEGQVKRQLSPTAPPSSWLGSQGGSHPPDSQIIDLTLDSDDEAEAPLPPKITGKRAAVEDGLGGSKRPRHDEPFSGKVTAPSPPATGSNAGTSPYVTGGGSYFLQRMNDPSYRLPPPESPSYLPSPFLAFARNGLVRYGSGSSSPLSPHSNNAHPPPPPPPSLPRPPSLPPSAEYYSPPRYPQPRDWP